MAIATKTWTFTSSTTGWSFTPTTTEVGSTSGTNGLVTTLSGKNLFASEQGASHGWELSDTFANIFGIPAGATVTQLGSGGSDGVTWLCTAFTTGGNNHSAALLVDINTGTTLCAGTNFTTTTSAATKALTPETISVAATSNCDIQLQTNLSTGNSNSAVMAVGIKTLVLSITYTAPDVTPPLPFNVDFAVARSTNY